MEKKKQLTCGFQLARNGKMCRCGKPATHRFINKALKRQDLPGGAA